MANNKIALITGEDDSSSAELLLKKGYEELVNDKMKSNLHLIMKDQYLQDGGNKTMNYFE